MNKRREAIAGAAVVALCGLAAKVNAPSFPVDGSPEDVQEWIIDVMKRVGDRLANENDIRLLRYVAGDYETPSKQNSTYLQLIDLADRLEKGKPR